MIAVGNRVLLRRVDYSLFGHVDLGFFVAAALEPGVFTGSSEHCAHGDGLVGPLLSSRWSQGGSFPSMSELLYLNWRFLGQGNMPQRLEGGTFVDFCGTSSWPDESYPPRGSVERN